MGVENLPDGIRVYTTESTGSHKLNFEGPVFPMTQEQVIPAMEDLLDSVILHLTKSADQGMKLIDLEETLGFLKELRSMTKPETGYIFVEEPLTEAKKKAVDKFRRSRNAAIANS